MWFAEHNIWIIVQTFIITTKSPSQSLPQESKDGNFPNDFSAGHIF